MYTNSLVDLASIMQTELYALFWDNLHADVMLLPEALKIMTICSQA